MHVCTRYSDKDTLISVKPKNEYHQKQAYASWLTHVMTILCMSSYCYSVITNSTKPYPCRRRSSSQSRHTGDTACAVRRRGHLLRIGTWNGHCMRVGKKTETQTRNIKERTKESCSTHCRWRTHDEWERRRKKSNIEEKMATRRRQKKETGDTRRVSSFRRRSWSRN